MTTFRAALCLVAVAGFTLTSSGCLATRKHVRNQIAPVQAQVNAVREQANENKQAIGDLDRNLSTTDEKATNAAADAKAAADAAQRANETATDARQRADSAEQVAQQTSARLDATIHSLDHYRLAATLNVYFRVGRSQLTPEGVRLLDEVIAKFSGLNGCEVEIQGSTDRSGGKAYNLALSQRRAEAVERYLIGHGVPLRRLHVIGVGSENRNASNSTRGARHDERRAEVRVYTLSIDLGSATAGMSSGEASTLQAASQQ